MIGLVMMVSMVMIFTELDTTVDTEDSVEREAKEVKVEREEVSDTNNVKQFANLLNTSQCHTTDRWSILCRSFLIRGSFGYEQCETICEPTQHKPMPYYR